MVYRYIYYYDISVVAYLDLFRQPAPLYKYNPDLYVDYPFRVPGYVVSENTGVYELPALKFWENSSANDEGNKTPQSYNQEELDNILQYCTETSVDINRNKRRKSRGSSK